MGQICTKCEQEKPSSEFYKRTSYGLNRSCKDCDKAYQKEYRQKNAHRLKAKRRTEADKLRCNATRIKRVYGLEVYEFEAMLKSSLNCGICGSEFTKDNPFCIDHCHVTEDVRGLLCRKCNLGIGNLNDNPSLLRKAISYLESHLTKSEVKNHG